MFDPGAAWMKHGAPQSPVAGAGLAGELLRSASVPQAASALLSALQPHHGDTLCVVVEGESQPQVLPPGALPQGEAMALARGSAGSALLQARSGALPEFTASERQLIELA